MREIEYRGQLQIKTGPLPPTDISRKPGYPPVLLHRTQAKVLIMLNFEGKYLTRRICEVISVLLSPTIEEIPTPEEPEFRRAVVESFY